MAITVRSVLSFFESWAPLDTACEWDNCGLQIGHPKGDVSKVLVSLDVDNPVLDAIENGGYELVITHHPVFFRPISKVVYGTDMAAILSGFMSNNVHLISMHTNLDAAAGGVNDCLIRQYGLDESKGQALKSGLGKWFDLDTETDVASFADVLPCRVVGDGSRSVKRIAFLGGSGGSFLPVCQRLGVDLYITGEMSYHDEVYCEMNGITTLLLGHKESEIFVLEEIKSRLESKFQLDVTVLS